MAAITRSRKSSDKARAIMPSVVGTPWNHSDGLPATSADSARKTAALKAAKAASFSVPIATDDRHMMKLAMSAIAVAAIAAAPKMMYARLAHSFAASMDKPSMVPRWLFLAGVWATFISGVVLPLVGLLVGVHYLGW